jgi:methyl-accepting chemotaxis protein
LKRDVAPGRSELAVMAALDRSQAIIEFTPSGEILTANQNFLSTFGYSLNEIVGRHHRIFVDPIEVAADGYSDFWAALGQGRFQSGEFRRLAKSGAEIWIQATYNPVLDADGAVERIIKFASDISAKRQVQKEIQNRTQGVIEFAPDGTILTANDLFLSAVGYLFNFI